VTCQGTCIGTATTVLERPSNFMGFNFSSGEEVTKLTATDWNNFMVKINDFATYLQKDDLTGSHTSVSPSNEILATYINQATRDLRAIGASSVPSDVSTGTSIMNSLFSQLKNSLNNIT